MAQHASFSMDCSTRHARGEDQMTSPPPAIGWACEHVGEEARVTRKPRKKIPTHTTSQRSWGRGHVGAIPRARGDLLRAGRAKHRSAAAYCGRITA
jgi:hypothetical protein